MGLYEYVVVGLAEDDVGDLVMQTIYKGPTLVIAKDDVTLRDEIRVSWARRDPEADMRLVEVVVRPFCG